MSLIAFAMAEAPGEATRASAPSVNGTQSHWSQGVRFTEVPSVELPMRFKPGCLNAPFPKTGRPTKYHSDYAEQVYDFMSHGYTLTAFAGSIGVNRSTLDNWMSLFPPFSEAVTRARAARLYYWERQIIGVAETGGSGQQGTIAMFGVKNASANMGAEEWRDKQEVAHSGQMTLAAALQASLKSLPEPEMKDITPIEE